MKNEQIIKLFETIQKYPIHLILTKYLILNGIDTEEKIIELLKTTNLQQKIKVDIQNSFRDLMINKVIDINKIPNIFK